MPTDTLMDQTIPARSWRCSDLGRDRDREPAHTGRAHGVQHLHDPAVGHALIGMNHDRQIRRVGKPAPERRRKSIHRDPLAVELRLAVPRDRDGRVWLAAGPPVAARGRLTGMPRCTVIERLAIMKNTSRKKTVSIIGMISMRARAGGARDSLTPGLLQDQLEVGSGPLHGLGSALHPAKK